MSALSRRNFLALTGSAAAAAMSGRLTNSASAAMGPADKFDLVIKGGEVIDPSQSLRAKRDIGIRWGVIEAGLRQLQGRGVEGYSAEVELARAARSGRLRR